MCRLIYLQVATLDLLPLELAQAHLHVQCGLGLGLNGETKKVIYKKKPPRNTRYNLIVMIQIINNE